MDLSKKSCSPHRRGDPPLSEGRIRDLAREVSGWALDPQEPRLQREFRFRDFAGALEFVERVAQIAQQEDHHPDIHIYYNRVVLVLWTHATGGLSENDFILAAKINTLKPRRVA
ncbi:MAG TPA: 4a-hydroxytetrahydrobiopterin dehydratase [Planctomycetota bacterium]|nr:4a-hydroxytetrahydrobiopterin dehydratase [Planctomycetota bacterium]